MSSAVPIVKSAPASFQVASTWPKLTSVFARVAAIVASDCVNPTVMIVLQPSSIRRWILGAKSARPLASL